MTGKKSTLERFYEKTEVVAEGCWLWTGGQSGRDRAAGLGYGVFYYENSRILAHRWSYQHFKGEIPEGMQIDPR